jgi:hypothetical protein
MVLHAVVDYQNDTAAWAPENRARFNTLMIAGHLIYNLEKPI